MRKPIVFENSYEKLEWPTQRIAGVVDDLYGYLSEYVPEQFGYTKTAIMGPVGKLLSLVESSRFGDNVDGYVGYIVNIHRQQSVGHNEISLEGMERLMKSVQTLLDLKKEFSSRDFHRIIRSVDYAVYFKKMKEIADKSEKKQQAAKTKEAQAT